MWKRRVIYVVTNARIHYLRLCNGRFQSRASSISCQIDLDEKKVCNHHESKQIRQQSGEVEGGVDCGCSDTTISVWLFAVHLRSHPVFSLSQAHEHCRVQETSTWDLHIAASLHIKHNTTHAAQHGNIAICALTNYTLSNLIPFLLQWSIKMQ